MNSPPPVMDNTEQAIDKNALNKLPCTDSARRMAGKDPRLTLNSEKGTISDKFGYIYRYNKYESVEDSGKVHVFDFVAVIWTKDCKKLNLAVYPVGRRPQSI